MRKPGRDRRKNSGDFRGQPRQSPATLLVLTVVAALLGSTVIAVVLGGGMEESTPHGQLLSGLQSVAERQESHHEANGRFAVWLRTLELEEPEGIELMVLTGNAERWEALARHPVGLTCSQAGSMERGRPVREEPVCFSSLPQ